MLAPPTLPLDTPMPRNSRLSRLCRALIEAPALEIDIDAMELKTPVSRRYFNRLFLQQIGTRFGAWRQQAFLLTALTRLGSGESINRDVVDPCCSSVSAPSVAF